MCKKFVAITAGYHIQMAGGGGGRADTSYRDPGGPEGDPEPDFIAYVFVFSVVSDVIRW